MCVFEMHPVTEQSQYWPSITRRQEGAILEKTSLEPFQTTFGGYDIYSGLHCLSFPTQPELLLTNKSYASPRLSRPKIQPKSPHQDLVVKEIDEIGGEQLDAWLPVRFPNQLAFGLFKSGVDESSWKAAATGGNAEPWLPAAAPWRPIIPPKNPTQICHPNIDKSSYK